jgi:hypothetical protein
MSKAGVVDLHAVDRRDAGVMLNPVFAPMLAPLISNGSDSNNQASETFENNDRELAADANGFIQQLFNPTPALENSSSHPTHRRPLTPTQEALHIQLQNIRLNSKDIMSTDYLEAAQCYLYETTRQKFPSRKITAYPTFTPMGSPDKFSEPGLSDASSDSNEQQTEPTTPDGKINFWGYPNTPSYILPLDPNIADHTKGNQAIGAAIQPSHINTIFARNVPIKSTGQIDPYIPAVVENDSPKFGAGTQPAGWSAKYQGSNNKYPIGDYGIIYNVPRTIPGALYVGMRATESFGVPHNCSNYNCNSAECFHNQLRIQNEQLTGKMQHYESLLRSSKEKLEYACSQALTNITIREAEIAKLRLQLRQQGLRPCSEPEGSEDLFFEKELSMLFRMLCCWGKCFYKFPTGELHSLPQNLHNFITEICEDKSNENSLMATHQTKYLVVVAMASRWMVEKILNPQFLDMAVELVKAAASRKENGPYRGSGDIIKGISRFFLLAECNTNDLLQDRDYETRLFDVIQETAGKRALAFINMIHPLMSRPTDKSHRGQTQKQFVQVAQHAARIVLDAARRESSLCFRFPRLGDGFMSSSMKDVTGDTLGLDVAPKSSTSIWHELHGDHVRLSVLPYVTACVTTDGIFGRTVNVYKANVLLC